MDTQAMAAETATTTGTEVAHDAGHAPKPFPPLHAPDFAPQIIWLAITFAALYLLLSRVVLPRIGEVIEDRKDRIRRDLEAAERLKDETDAALKGYEKALADARSNAGAIAKDNQAKLNAEIDADRQKADAALNAKLAEAERSIAATKSKAMQSVSDIAADTAAELAKALSGQNVTIDEAKRAVTAASGK
jgi:F-type H+-transporting ATPase subunit b